jgi:subfamily B ATP-binding cassette protein MsbA
MQIDSPMLSFVGKLLVLCRPYRNRFILGILMGILAGFLEPLLMVSVKMALEAAFPGTSPLSGNSTSLSPERITNSVALASRLTRHEDPVSQYVWEDLSRVTREKIAATNSPPLASNELAQVLAKGLNLVTTDPNLYSPQRFAGVKLTPAAAILLATSPDGDDLVKLNIRLLESAYPAEMKASKPGFLEKYAWTRNLTQSFNKWMRSTHGSRGNFYLVLMILLIPVTMFLRGMVSYLNIYLLQWVAVRAITDLRTNLFDRLLNQSLAYLNRYSTGELLSRVSNDTASIQNLISFSLVSLIKDPATLVGLAAYLLSQYPMLTLMSLIVFPLSLFPIVIFTRKVKKSGTGIQSQYASMGKVMLESFTGNRIIKAYNLENQALHQFKESSKAYISYFMRAVRASEIPGPLIEFMGAIGIAGLFYFILIVSKQRMDASDFAVFILAMFSMYRPIKNLTKLYSQFAQAQAASELVFQILDTPSTLTETANPKPVHGSGADIQFDHIDFNYDTKPVLRDFNLTIKPGQMVALVGHTGSGKTTVTNLLLRFYDPQKGAVRIGGLDIREASLKDLRNQIAVVTQDTLLFDETIRRNIELGRPGASEEDIIAAAKAADAHEFIIAKPQGYDTMVGEKGVLLSGGQKQRLAIARAILKSAPILILDEATSSLDNKTERVVQAALEKLMVGRATLCIAHRLSTIARADTIVVLDQGRIIEMGRHEDLIAQGGAYQKLHQLSTSSEETDNSSS